MHRAFGDSLKLVLKTPGSLGSLQPKVTPLLSPQSYQNILVSMAGVSRRHRVAAALHRQSARNFSTGPDGTKPPRTIFMRHPDPERGGIEVDIENNKLPIALFAGEIIKFTDKKGEDLYIRQSLPTDSRSIEEELLIKLSPENFAYRFPRYGQESSLKLSRGLAYGDVSAGNDRILVAHNEKREIVGVVDFWMPSSELTRRYSYKNPLLMCEVNLVVSDEYQGRGIGAKLVHEALRNAAKSGYAYAAFEIAHENIRMHRLAERLGFVKKESDDRSVLYVAPISPEPV